MFERTASAAPAPAAPRAEQSINERRALKVPKRLALAAGLHSKKNASREFALLNVTKVLQTAFFCVHVLLMLFEQQTTNNYHELDRLDECMPFQLQ